METLLRVKKIKAKSNYLANLYSAMPKSKNYLKKPKKSSK